MPTAARSNRARRLSDDGLAGVEHGIPRGERPLAQEDDAAGPDVQLWRAEVVALDLLAEVEDTIDARVEELRPDDEALLLDAGPFRARLVGPRVAEVEERGSSAAREGAVDPREPAVLFRTDRIGVVQPADDRGERNRRRDERCGTAPRPEEHDSPDAASPTTTSLVGTELHGDTARRSRIQAAVGLSTLFARATWSAGRLAATATAASAAIHAVLRDGRSPARASTPPP